MFSGLVSLGARVEEIKILESFRQISLSFNDSAWLSMNPQLGSSIAINGVCLSVVSFEKRGDRVWARFDVSPESLEITNLKDLNLGELCHFEMALKVGQEMGGHWVLGHVDGTGQVLSLEKQGEGYIFIIQIRGAFKDRLAKWVISKGSISVDGVSLTINEIKDLPDSLLLSFFLIPHTLANTRFLNLELRASVNLEADVLGKYVERFESLKRSASL
jgi:riboflavin synthase